MQPRRSDSERVQIGERGTPPPLWFAVLGLLVEEAAHPYAVARRFEQRVGSAWALNRAQIYQVVRGMESHGLVAADGPPAGEGVTSRRTVVRATELGRAAFDAWLRSTELEDPGPVRNALFIRLSFLRPEHVPTLLRVIDRREQHLLGRIRQYAEECPELGAPLEDVEWETLGSHLILDGALATLQGELRWLRRVRETLEGRLEADA